jgi:hypothetical protein
LRRSKTASSGSNDIEHCSLDSPGIAGSSFLVAWLALRQLVTGQGATDAATATERKAIARSPLVPYFHRGG